MGDMQDIAIFDMDRTITIRGTYTPFLLFAAARRQRWRLLLTPVLLFALAGAGLGLLTRNGYKNIGFRLMIGSTIEASALSSLAESFAANTIDSNVHAASHRQIALEKQDGRVVVMATAAPEYYATEIGRRLGMDVIIATRQSRNAQGDYLAAIDGANCYGEEKLGRIKGWMDAMHYERAASNIRFYSDHISDAPILAWADTAVAVRPDRKLRALAEKRGWQIVDHS